MQLELLRRCAFCQKDFVPRQKNHIYCNRLCCFKQKNVKWNNANRQLKRENGLDYWHRRHTDPNLYVDFEIYRAKKRIRSYQKKIEEFDRV